MNCCINDKFCKEIKTIDKEIRVFIKKRVGNNQFIIDEVYQLSLIYIYAQYKKNNNMPTNINDIIKKTIILTNNKYKNNSTATPSHTETMEELLYKKEQKKLLYSYIRIQPLSTRVIVNRFLTNNSIKSLIKNK